MGRATVSSSSSIDSSNHPSLSSASSLSQPNTDLSTDLSLGLGTSISQQEQQQQPSNSREQPPHWPPIKPLLRSTLAGKGRLEPTFFVKVYKDGIPIGRKLDLLAHGSYDALVTTLGRMFKTTILWPDADRAHSEKYHVLTYEDKEGDWMMVGDVPWEMFLTTVKRLKITRADKC